MKISELGEFGLIDLLAGIANTADRHTASRQRLIIGVGDDAAAWQGNAQMQLATIDSLIQDVHFSLNYTPWQDLGWKALAVNLSDIAAMGGAPMYALASLALPGDTEVDDVTALYQGMAKLAEQSGVVIIGGDISRAPLVAITITVLGNARDQFMLTRSAASPGEQIAVTGELGGAAAGMETLTRQLEFDTGAMNALRNAFLHPQPRITEGQLLVQYGVRTAIDISDGLVADLTHICQQSRVDARIEVERIPVHPAAKAGFGDRSLELALSGGEDYELLFTATPKVINRVKRAASCPITIIGETTAENTRGVTLVDRKGNPLRPGKWGWEHFSAE
jgi:thiamine-monophosphate kinase